MTLGSALVDAHFAAGAVEGKADLLAGAETQETRLLVARIRIRLAAVTELEEQTVAAGHKRPLARLAVRPHLRCCRTATAVGPSFGL